MRANQAKPVFLISPRYRNEVAAAIEANGRPVTAMRRARDAERRFTQTAAAVAVVDARGALEEGLNITQLLASRCEVAGAALLILLSRGDAATLEQAYDAGATHFLMSPFTNADLNQAIRFAERMARRMSGRNNVALARSVSRDSDQPGWSWAIGAKTLRLTPSLAALVGIKSGELRITAAVRRLDGDGIAMARDAVRRLLGSGRATAFAHDLRVGGRLRRLAHHLRIERDATGAVIGIGATVEDLESAAEDRRQSANFDQLTGLANAEFTRRWIEGRLAEPVAVDPPMVLLLIALRRFDEINAAYGRRMADMLLQSAARRIDRLVDDNDGEAAVVGRMAGAEFGVALAAPITLRDATFLAERLVDSFARPFVAAGQVVHLGCHIGIAVAQPGEGAVETLLRRASAAVAQSKERDGQGMEIVLADEAEDERLSKRAALDADLREALNDGQILLFYQPQVAIVGGHIEGVEALVRWRHPKLGLLSAETLLAAADRAGLADMLSRHIVNGALRDAARWPEPLGALRLSVNLTAENLATPGFMEGFLEAVRKSGFPPSRLTVEVTESGLIEDIGAAANLLATLRSKGLRVAADDFGTGYSSLAYLKSLPLDYLKLDKHLTNDITGSPRDRVVTRGIIEMARSLGLMVVAEGVENEAQLSLLAREGCNMYQGFLCSPPMSGEELPGFIERWEAALPTE